MISKNFLLIRIFVSMLTIANTQFGICQTGYLNPDIPLSNSMGIVSFLHINRNGINDSSHVRIGETMGRISKFPDMFSNRFDNEIRSSMKYYENNNFVKARSVLEEAIIADPENPFIMNSHARAAYQSDRSKSLEVYKKLIDYLDRENKNSKTNTVVDLWFREAYWKYGTLLMDSKDWNGASYQISRFLMSIQETKGTVIYNQAIEYLLECAYNSYDDKTAAYLAKRLISYDPKNKYAIDVLSKMKK